MRICSSLMRISWKKYMCAAIVSIALYGLLSAPFNMKAFHHTVVRYGMISNNSRNFSNLKENHGFVTEMLRNLHMKKRFDATRKYAIQDFAIIGENLEHRENFSKVAPCLAAQGSILYLHHIPFMVKQWQGMVSVAVFVPEVDFHLAVLYIENMRRCHSEVRKNVTFHFVYPLEYPATLSLEALDYDAENCSTWNLNLMQWNHFNSSKTLYPQNVLRNVARKSCPTDYVLLIDIDMIPSQGMAPKLETFLSSDNVTKCNNCAYVVPAYETAEDSAVPNNKSELLDLVQRKLARPYRKIAFNDNQAATNASLWEKLPPSCCISVGYQLRCFRFYYEPFFVARDSVPPHDERFLGYGFTRNTQVYETQLAGYRFFVLDNAFIIQHNMATTANSSPSRTAQVNNNSKLFQKLQKEFSIKYEQLKDLPCNMTDKK